MRPGRYRLLLGLITFSAKALRFWTLAALDRNPALLLNVLRFARSLRTAARAGRFREL